MRAGRSRLKPLHGAFMLAGQAAARWKLRRGGSAGKERSNRKESDHAQDQCCQPTTHYERLYSGWETASAFTRNWEMWQIRESHAKSIFTPVSGFLKQAGFTHSLSPARNCTYGCTYCYVPTMGMYAGLSSEEVRKWGQFTTLKTNAAELVARGSTSQHVVYCSPLVDPYQPAEREQPRMPELLSAFAERPPRVLVLQTRGPLILRDLDLLQQVAKTTILRISFSITTDQDEVRRHYEPRCESNQTRLEVVRALRAAGLEVYATLAPLLPCNPERLAEWALDASRRDLIGDPLHVRATKPRGATTRALALRIAQRYGDDDWFRPGFQRLILQRIQLRAARAGYRFASGPEGFGRLARQAGCAF